MRFSESHAPVDKERVIDASGIFGDRKGSGMRKIIVFTDDKGIEGIAGIQLCIGQNLLTHRLCAIAGRLFFLGAVKGQAAG